MWFPKASEGSGVYSEDKPERNDDSLGSFHWYHDAVDEEFGEEVRKVKQEHGCETVLTFV